MKKFLVGLVLCMAFSLLNINSFAKEVLSKENGKQLSATEVCLRETKEVSSLDGFVVGLNFYDFRDGRCFVKITCRDKDEEILPEIFIDFFDNKGGYYRVINGKMLNIFYTKSNGGCVAAFLDGKPLL